MNKQIRLLAEQAGLRFTQLMSNPMVPVVDGKETDLAKFAELIVADCVNYINTEIDRLHDYQNSLPEYSNHSKREDVDLVIEKCLDNIQGIKQHFGVK